MSSTDSKQQQFSQLLRPLLPASAGYAHSILRDRHLAEDAVQQAALRAFENFHSFDQTRSFRQWWFAIVHNCCIDLVRADKSASHISVDELDETASHENNVAETLMSAIGLLSADHQEILRLKYFADLSYKEIAATLEIPPGTVMSRLHLARLALASKMRELQ
ncbi:MAG TPA: sigma-70 family RNA polymerase sigma factor [Pseudohongiella sp.]|nr:sigma-70 family RNA polymerase sigma factor [Pseudohongiella sp.]